MDQLEKLVAIEEIKKLKARYCRFSDTRDDEAFEALFTDDVEWTLMGLDGTTVLKKIRGKKEHHEWRASLRETRLAGISVHHCHTPEIEIIDENHATGIWALSDYIRQPAEGKNYQGYGHYHEEYVRQNGQWLISKVTVTRLHVEPRERIDQMPAFREVKW